MRNLQFSDVFAVIRIVKKAGLSRQARSMAVKAAESKGGIDPKELGMEFIFSIIEGLGDSQEEVISFFAKLKGVEESEIEKLSLEETVGMFEDFLKLPGLKGFFSKVLNTMK